MDVDKLSGVAGTSGDKIGIPDDLDKLAKWSEVKGMKFSKGQVQSATRRVVLSPKQSAQASRPGGEPAGRDNQLMGVKPPRQKTLGGNPRRGEGWGKPRSKIAPLLVEEDRGFCFVCSIYW